jgi:hypothetical protein
VAAIGDTSPTYANVVRLTAEIPQSHGIAGRSS